MSTTSLLRAIRSHSLAKAMLPGAAVLALAACATTNPSVNTPPKQEVDASGQVITQAGDIAIAGQMVAHSIIELPEVAEASKPPLVRFAGVTTIVNGPVDTMPYTTLLRDRLLLLTREKLRFVERTLPPLSSHKIKHNKDLSPSVRIDSNADYQILARLQGNFDDDTYLLAVRFYDLHLNQAVFTGLYRIRKEEQNGATGMTDVSQQQVQPAQPQNPQIESTEPNPPVNYDPPPPPPSRNNPGGNSGLQ